MIDLILGCSLALLVPSVAYWKQALTLPGSLLAMAMGLVCTFAEPGACYLLIAFFVVLSLIEKLLKPKVSPLEEETVQKTGARDVYQVAANGGVGLFFVVLYLIFQRELFLVAFGAAIAESFADSLASSVGMAARKTTYDICTFRKMEPGYSGGISFPGTLAAFLGSAFLGLLSWLFGMTGLSGAVILSAAAFLGCLCDSILGSRFQRKNRCTVCKAVTEKTLHCDRETEYFSGVRWLNNDGVNAACNLLAAIFALLFCIL